ncbi:MAG: helix-turn-helix domain-containing protein, partial [Firmicutes bacterium]|nr:helix-turn-helix domain-containing protein [Bacillota bacterium]
CRFTSGPLLDYDEKHNTRLVHTLNLYFKNNGNLQKAARDGFMNSSTMKYRLRRIHEIANINLSDPEVNLQVQLALKIIEGLR